MPDVNGRGHTSIIHFSPVLQVMEECSQSGGEHGRQDWIMEGFNATRQMEVDSA